MFRNRPVSLALVGLFVWVTGCTYHSQLVLDEVDQYGKVHVTTPTGLETLYEPTVVSDTLTGLTEDGEGRAIPLKDVLKLEASGTNVAGTVTLAVLGAGLIAAAIALSTYEMCILSC